MRFPTASIFLVVFTLSSSAVTHDQLRYYLLSNGAPEPVGLGSRVEMIQTGDQIEATRWDPTLPPFPDEAGVVPQHIAAAAATIPAKYLRVDSGVLFEMTPEEKAVVDAAEAEAAEAAEAAKQAAKQAAKPIERKVAENAYFDICATILAAVSDPRATNQPPPKLTIPELNSAIEALSASDFQSGAMLSLKLLAINAALIRYDILWWEDAAYHPEIVAP